MTGYDYDAYLGFKSKRFPFFGNIKKNAASSIHILGGSTAIGIGVKEKRNMSFSVMEKKLAGENLLRTNHVINFGVPEFVSNQEAGIYKEYIFKLSTPPKEMSEKIKNYIRKNDFFSLVHVLIEKTKDGKNLIEKTAKKILDNCLSTGILAKKPRDKIYCLAATKSLLRW